MHPQHFDRGDASSPLAILGGWAPRKGGEEREWEVRGREGMEGKGRGRGKEERVHPPNVH